MGTTIGRLYFYVVSFITLLMVAYAAGSLVSSAIKFFLEPGSLTGDTGYWRRVLSAYLPMIIVGAPLWAVHWLASQRRAYQAPQEQQAPLRKLFLNAVLTVASLAATFNAVRFIYHFLGYLTGTSIAPVSLPPKIYDVFNAGVWLVVYSFIWYYHWEVEKEEGQSTRAARTLRRWYIYIVSLISLSVLGAGIFMNLSLIISFVTGGLAQQIAGAGTPTLLKRWSLSFAPIIGGAAWWSFHWLYLGRKDAESLLRHVYLYFFVFVGLALTVSGLGALLFEALRYAFGYRAISVSAQLSTLQYALPALIIGGGAWAYHWNVVLEDALPKGRGDLSTSSRQSLAPTGGALAGVRRRYNYLVSLAGLLSVTVGLASLIRVLLEIGFGVGQELKRSPDWWRDQLSVFIVLTVIGLAVWLPHWVRMQRLVEEEGDVERTALSRRLVLYLVIFASVIGILFNGAFLLNGLLRLVLGEPITRRFTATIFSNIGNVTVIGTFLFYHWRILNQDRELTTDISTVDRKHLMVLASPGLQNRVRQLEAALGTQITVLDEVRDAQEPAQAEVEATAFAESEVEDLVNKIKRAPSNKVLLILSPTRVEVHPYR